MFKQKGATTLELILAAIVLLGCGGWIANIVKIIGAFDSVATGMFIARCIGVFIAPLGAVLGYL